MSVAAPSSGTHQISSIDVTPVAFQDLPLLNTVGVHEPYALRSIIQVHTDSGLYGLGETYGDQIHLDRLRRAADVLVGADVFSTHALTKSPPTK